MKLAHVIALVVFAIVLISSGGNYANGVQTGAACGFWISLILGSLITLIMLLVLLIGMAGGGVAGHQVGGPIGALFGSLGVGVLLSLLIITSILAVVLAVLGYDALRNWGASNLQDQNALIKACVFLGLSIIFSLLAKRKKK